MRDNTPFEMLEYTLQTSITQQRPKTYILRVSEDNGLISNGKTSLQIIEAKIHLDRSDGTKMHIDWVKNSSTCLEEPAMIVDFNGSVENPVRFVSYNCNEPSLSSLDQGITGVVQITCINNKNKLSIFSFSLSQGAYGPESSFIVDEDEGTARYVRHLVSLIREGDQDDGNGI